MGIKEAEGIGRILSWKDPRGILVGFEEKVELEGGMRLK